MSGNFERSPEIQEKIDNIRSESQDSRETAQLGRMEILLKNGFAERIFGTLDTEPDISKEE